MGKFNLIIWRWNSWGKKLSPRIFQYFICRSNIIEILEECHFIRWRNSKGMFYYLKGEIQWYIESPTYVRKCLWQTTVDNNTYVGHTQVHRTKITSLRSSSLPTNYIQLNVIQMPIMTPSFKSNKVLFPSCKRPQNINIYYARARHSARGQESSKFAIKILMTWIDGR